jgi:hypothetical protein
VMLEEPGAPQCTEAPIGFLADAPATFALHDLFVNERAGLESATALRFSLSDSEFAYETFAVAAETHALEFVLTAEPVPALPAHAEEPAVLGAV